MSYSGKQFEEDFAKSHKADPQNTFLLRLYDTTNGFRGVANPCDFILGGEIGTVLLELKTTKGASFPLSNISDRQYEWLLGASSVPNTHCGVLIHFQRYDEIRWVNIRDIAEVKNLGGKSINPITKNIGRKLDGVEKRRTRWKIPVHSVILGIIGG